MTELFDLKDLVYLAFLGVALYLHGHSRWKDGVKTGIEAGIEGTIDNLVKDGYIDYDEKTGEISAKIAK